MEPLHEARDGAKVQALMVAMETNGWQGEPLVVWGEQLLTGTHRYAAWRELHHSDGDLPTVAIEDVYAEAGLDFTALCEEAAVEGVDDLIFYVLPELPVAIAEKYGIDIR